MMSKTDYAELVRRGRNRADALAKDGFTASEKILRECAAAIASLVAERDAAYEALGAIPGIIEHGANNYKGAVTTKIIREVTLFVATAIRARSKPSNKMLPAAALTEAGAGEAKPIGYARAIDVDPAKRPFEGQTSFWCSERQNAYYNTPVYASPPPVQPVVKALEWTAGDGKDTDPNYWMAPDGLGGYYAVCECQWWHPLLHIGNDPARTEATDDAAKAAAQADFEKRILSALTAASRK